jgi:hypothetical protein
MSLPCRALAVALLAAGAAAPARPLAAEAWQAYPQQYPLPQFVGGAAVPGERPRSAPVAGARGAAAPAAAAQRSAPAALPSRAAAPPAPPVGAPAAQRCPAGLAPGTLLPKAGLRGAPDLAAPVTAWNLDRSRGCFSPEAGGYRRAELADGRAGHVKDELVELSAAASVADAPEALAPAAAEVAIPAAPLVAAGAAAPSVAPAALEVAAPLPAEPQLELSRVGPGLGVGIEQTHESDRIRQAWLARGGNIGALEVGGGGSFLFKRTSDPFVGTTEMVGIGLSLSTRFSRLVFSPPQWERGDRSWGAFKFGVGTDFAFFDTSISTDGAVFTHTSATMQSFSLVGTLGFTRAFGSFSSQTRWSGVALGLEWAPSYTMTKTTFEDAGAGLGAESESSSFNATGFAFSIESGSLEALTATLAKKAHLKFRVFVLPPIDDLPLFVNASVGAVLY